jgi:hypothetical protein
MNRADFIFKLYPQIVTIRGDVAYDADDNIVEYDPALVDAEIAKTEYQRQRAAEYPSFADQFDLLYHGGYDSWKAAIDAVKTKYPKPE